MSKSIPSLILKLQSGQLISVKDKDVVGRTAVGAELLSSSEGVSRRHVQFFHNKGEWFVADLGSKNGTTINDNKIPANQMTIINERDTITLSKTFSGLVYFNSRKNPEVVNENLAEDRRLTMAVMFVDLKGSTNYFQEKGTMVASSWINNFYKMLTGVVVNHCGQHIKNIGDAILAVFPDPIDAARAAIEMQYLLKTHNKKLTAEDHYSIRIGMDMGRVLYENNDVFGNVVNIAARIQGQAPPGQTYISHELFNHIEKNGEFTTEFVCDQSLRGVKEKMQVYDLRGEHISPETIIISV